MLSDKEIKKQYRPKFWAEPEKFYASEALREEGYSRGICTKCGKPFWATDADRPVCGDPACSPGESFAFIGNTPAGRSMDYIEIWTRFAKMFEGFGYTPIARYPAVARWNPTMEYTNASIAAFQPFVIAGEMDPPANPLVIPQFCLRFSDIDNVGSGRLAGAITAALFLQDFVTETPAWAHLDLYAWNDKTRPGRPIGGEAMGLRALHALLAARYPA